MKAVELVALTAQMERQCLQGRSLRTDEWKNEAEYGFCVN